jgi:hypothetical protein
MTLPGVSHGASLRRKFLIKNSLKLAEGMGFEPTIQLSSYNGLANRRLQPLGHPSLEGSYFLPG